MAVGTPEKRFKILKGPCLSRVPRLPAHRRQGPAQQSRRPPFRAMGIQPYRRTFHNPLAPATFGHEHFILMRDEVFLHQRMPLLQTHGMVLANSEALLLMRSDHIANDISKQSPI